MTPRQKIELRRSEIRQRLAAIAGLEGDSLTEAIGTERDGLLAELAATEPQLRAAIAAEETEARQRGDQQDGDGEGAELRALETRASIGAVFGAAVSHGQTDGATGELQRHLGLAANQIPLALLRDPVEGRAVTPAPASGVQQNQSMIIPGVFPRAAGSWLSVDMPTVPTGDASFPVLTQNATPATPAKGAPVDETTGAFSAGVLMPARVQASFFYAREDAARFAGMDEALRMNLSDALSDKLDERIIAAIIAGVGRTNATGVFDYAGYKSLVYGQIDGRYAWGAEDIRVLVGAATLGVMASTYLAMADSTSTLDQLSRTSGGVRVSAHIPDAHDSGKKQDAIVRLGMRRDAVAPIWEGPTIIVDEVTKAGTGEIVLTAVMLYAVAILRAAAFRRIETQHSA